MIETENKIILIVDRKTTRTQVKKQVEDEFKVKVGKVNISVIAGGKKKAYIKIVKGKASDIATRLGVL